MSISVNRNYTRNSWSDLLTKYGLLLVMFSILLLSSTDFVVADTNVPQIVTSNSTNELVLPEKFKAVLAKDYPEFVVPDTNSLPEMWKYIWGKTNAFPFICWGDFNGDGLSDIAIILTSSTSEQGVFAIYHQQSQSFVKAYEFNKWRYGPTEVALRLIKKSAGFSYPTNIRHKGQIRKMYDNDAVEFAFDDGPVAVIYYVNGIYRSDEYGNT